MSGDQCVALSAKGARCLRSAEGDFDTCPMHRDPRFARISEATAATNRCAGKTTRGTPCRRQATEGTDTCFVHSPDGPPPRYRRMQLGLSPALAGVVALPPPAERPKLNRNPTGLRARWEELLDRVADGEQPYQVTQRLGFHRCTLAGYLRGDPDMVADLMAAEAVAAERVEAALYQRALDGDTRAAALWLTNRSSDRWRDARRVEVSGSVQHELDAGPAVERIAELTARLQARAVRLELESGAEARAVESGDILDAEVVSDEADQQ